MFPRVLRSLAPSERLVRPSKPIPNSWIGRNHFRGRDELLFGLTKPSGPEQCLCKHQTSVALPRVSRDNSRE